MNKIQIKNITKKYNNLTALDDVSFSFEFGKIYGLLGRNGAGKSTLINIIANRIFADEGMILVDDIPAKENMQVHEKVFCMSEADLYDKDLKIKEHFRWINRFYDCFDLNKALTIAKMFDLDINKKFRSLSKGYQSIFKLTAALSLNIPYVIFDEPVLGLDANHRELFYELLLQDFENNERTIIIATHLIEEVTNIIEEVVLIDHGKIILQDTVGRAKGCCCTRGSSLSDCINVCIVEDLSKLVLADSAGLNRFPLTICNLDKFRLLVCGR